MHKQRAEDFRMLFPTFTFFAFFIPFLALNWFLKRWPLAWRIFLLAASYAFYATWSLHFLLIIVGVTLWNFYFARSGNYLKTAIAGNLFVLFIFKYYDFFRVSAETLLGHLHLTVSLPVLNLLLPLGLSFYILRAISYQVDLRRGKIAPASLLNLGIYISFFPQLLSGPIARPGDFLPQLENGGATAPQNIHEQFGLILRGLLKKVAIASYFSLSAFDAAFTVPGTFSRFELLLAIYGYAILIYVDFSGYTDIATGIAGLMGFTSPMNFMRPYTATSIQDFWRRWHISFSEWLRDYVYIPLGGSRVGKIRTAINSMATMLVSGLWHGAGLNYLVWGGVHGVALMIQRVSGVTHDVIGTFSKWQRYILGIITFNFVAFAWIFFRISDVNQGWDMVKSVFTSSALRTHAATGFVIVLILSAIFLALEDKLVAWYEKLQSNVPLLFQIIIATAIVVIIIELGPDIVPPFIYFQF
jgi:alginate O-acetyltransferase complex protein AlgI